jgi:hypothetical protein
VTTTANTVTSFNGVTGAVTGVNSVNGSTGAVTGLATTSGTVASFNGATGAVTGVSSFNGVTGAVTGVSSIGGSTGALSAAGTGNIVRATGPSLDGPVTVATATTTTVPLKVQTTATSATANIFEVRNTVLSPTDPMFRVAANGDVETWESLTVGNDIISSLGAFSILGTGDASFNEVTVAAGLTAGTLDVSSIITDLIVATDTISAGGIISSSSGIECTYGLLTASYNDYGSILNGGILPFDTYNVIKITPGSTGTSTITAGIPPAGTVCNLIITSNVSGSSRTIAFGTSTFRTTSSLVTTGSGTLARTYSISFVSDGGKLTEIARTGSMVT